MASEKDTCISGPPAAEQAGIKPGDLVVSVNGTNPREAPPQLAASITMTVRLLRTT